MTISAGKLTSKDLGQVYLVTTDERDVSWAVKGELVKIVQTKSAPTTNEAGVAKVRLTFKVGPGGDRVKVWVDADQALE